MAVVVLAAMRSELRPFVRATGIRRTGADADADPAAPTYAGRVGGHEVVATTMGVGMAGAARTAERVLESHDVDLLVVVGIAGGIDATLPIGHVLVPEVVVDGGTGGEYHPPTWDPVAVHGRLVTYDSFQTEPEVLADLQRKGFAAIDMETAAVAAVCERRSCPYAVIRAISDNATDGSVDAAVAAMARADGTPDLRAALRYVVRRPWRIPHLVRLGTDAHRAARAAADAAVAALSQ
ncbi:MAG: hypothetical protein ACRD2C_27825 [Acidimicrobiales bacterium]